MFHVPGHGIQITPNMINIKKEETGATSTLAWALPNFPQNRTATCLGQYSAIMERCKLGFELLATRIDKATNPLSVDSQDQWNHEHSHDKASATASLWGIRQISHEKIGSYIHARRKPVSRIAVAKPNNELKDHDRENYRQLYVLCEVQNRLLRLRLWLSHWITKCQSQVSFNQITLHLATPVSFCKPNR